MREAEAGGLAASKLAESVLWTGQTGGMKAINSDQTGILQPSVSNLMSLDIYFTSANVGSNNKSLFLITGFDQYVVSL